MFDDDRHYLTSAEHLFCGGFFAAVDAIPLVSLKRKLIWSCGLCLIKLGFVCTDFTSNYHESCAVEIYSRCGDSNKLVTEGNVDTGIKHRAFSDFVYVKGEFFFV